MKAGKLESMIGNQGSGVAWHNSSGHWRNLQRYAAMCGIDLPNYTTITDEREAMCAIEIPVEAVQKILALDYAERATADLRAMGEGVAKLKVTIPSNINVWGHTRGTSQLVEAAQKLALAAEAIGDRAQSVA